MCRTAVGINVCSVRLIIDHIGFLPGERQTHFLAIAEELPFEQSRPTRMLFEITAWNRDQITDITVSSGSKIYCSSNILAGCQRKLFQLSIQVSLDPCLYLSLDLLSVSVKKLDSIVMKKDCGLQRS